jgi:hypothetical protein
MSVSVLPHDSCTLRTIWERVVKELKLPCDRIFTLYLAEEGEDIARLPTVHVYQGAEETPLDLSVLFSNFFKSAAAMKSTWKILFKGFIEMLMNESLI